MKENGNYNLSFIVTNTSIRGGIPAAAILTTETRFGLISDWLVRNDSTLEFGPNEKRWFLFPFTVPAGTGGSSANLDIVVYPPDKSRILAFHQSFIFVDYPLISGRLGGVVAVEGDLNKRVYLNLAGGNGFWAYILKTLTISWLNTGSSPTAGYIDAVLHPYAPGSGFCRDQALTPIAGQGAVVAGGAWGAVQFAVPYAVTGIISARLSSPTKVLQEAPVWDTETQNGILFNAVPAPGGAILASDFYQCPI